jgi:hypothetical protein
VSAVAEIAQIRMPLFRAAESSSAVSLSGTLADKAGQDGPVAGMAILKEATSSE